MIVNEYRMGRSKEKYGIRRNVEVNEMNLSVNEYRTSKIVEVYNV